MAKRYVFISHLGEVEVTVSKYKSEDNFIRDNSHIMATPYTYLAVEDHEVYSAIKTVRHLFDKVNK